MAKTIEQEYVSSPSRPPRYHPFFSTNNADGENVRFFTHAFRTAYAAHHYITTIMTACADSCTTNWKDEATIVFTHTETGATLTIKEYSLEDIIEYEPTKEEKAWTPDSARLERLTHFWTQRALLSPSHNTDSEDSSTSSTQEPEPSRAKTQNRHKSQKEAPSGMTTVAILAAEANIPANKARQMLRKAGIKKPQGGWTFKTSDPLITTITELFGKG